MGLSVWWSECGGVWSQVEWSGVKCGCLVWYGRVVGGLVWCGRVVVWCRLVVWFSGVVVWWCGGLGCGCLVCGGLGWVVWWSGCVVDQN